MTTSPPTTTATPDGYDQGPFMDPVTMQMMRGLAEVRTQIRALEAMERDLAEGVTRRIMDACARPGDTGADDDDGLAW